ncbi:Avo2p Ecym_3409 [Eremothecium cymbalariae DBVPG|uniref:Uncharacterized protein n=1 Tax=Eremothecium cymbalariae (strain CBS 270.75 / DBVPG 7215 / KCTC 17166 / NRRL Y-17582) TaxID=931890 RepID=G8JRX6_ERECY|nr:Hypothetical protein Ecym_3409 [Eremothecium cymbalariae DBVPG\
MLPDPSFRLREAIIEGNLLIVKLVLRRWPELLTNIDPLNGWSSLHYAAYHGRYLICVQLIQLSYGKGLTLRTFKGSTSVHLALMNGHEQTTHLLLQHYPQCLMATDERGRTPAHIACLFDYHKCLSLLVSAGTDLSLGDNNGDTPLHIAMMYGSVECMNLLIHRGSVRDYTRKNKANWSPVQVAQTVEMEAAFNRIVDEVKLQPVTNQKNVINSPSKSVTVFQSRGTSLESPGFSPAINVYSAIEDSEPSPTRSLTPSSVQPQQSPTYQHHLPPLPTISTSRRPSSTTPTSNYFPRTPVSLKFMNAASIAAQSNISLSRTRTSNRSSVSSVSNSLRHRDSITRIGNVSLNLPSSSLYLEEFELNEESTMATVVNALPISQIHRPGNAEMINKYLSDEGPSSFTSPSLPQQLATSKSARSPGGHQSLLNIPISKVRI